MSNEPDDSPQVKPLDYMSRTEWYGNSTTPAGRWMADQDDATFEAALTEARAEGDLSRANVARKMGWTSPETRRTRRNVSAEERGSAAIRRLLNKVDPTERDAWIDGALDAINETRG